MEQDYRPSKDLRDALVIISSTTTALGTNLTLTDSALTEGDDYWNNMAVVILSGNSIGQIRRISDFDAASDTITIDTAFASVIASGTKYNIIAQHAPVAIAATDKGVRQVFEKAITAAANVGVAQTVGTVATQACIIESIIVYANTAQTADLVSYSVTGATGVITFLDGADTAAQVLNVADEQLAWTGSVRLATGKTIEIIPTGTGATAVDLTVAVTYYSSGGNGGVIS